MNDTYITITGWVGSEVTVTEVGPDTSVATFRVGSTPRRFRRTDATWVDGETIWFTVKAWRALAEHAAASLVKGDPVVVHGRLEADVWVREDGTRSTRFVLVAISVGHDLARGTATFVKAPRRTAATTTDPSRAVIHGYDEDEPRLDADGEPVTDAAGVPAA